MSTMTMVLTCVQSNHQMHQSTRCVHNNGDYTICRFNQQLVQLLTRFYQFDFLKPILHTVPLIDSTVATVTIFDF